MRGGELKQEWPKPQSKETFSIAPQGDAAQIRVRLTALRHPGREWRGEFTLILARGFLLFLISAPMAQDYCW